jgi:hypothetical protein
VVNGTGEGFSPNFFKFPLLIIIPPFPEVCDSPNQAAHYHILGFLSWSLHLRKGTRLLTEEEVGLQARSQPYGATIMFAQSVRPYGCNKSTMVRRIFMKLDTRGFYENLPSQFNFHLDPVYTEMTTAFEV